VKRSAGLSSALVLVVLWSVSATAQELTPRAYWPSPKGTKVAVLGYSHVQGDVLFDPSIPLYGVDSNIRTAILAYLQTFSLAGRTTNVVIELPYSWGTTQGLVDETPGRRDFSAFNDLGLTLSVNLLGAPTMTPPEFQALRADPHLIVGASLKIRAPTGQYDGDRLINVGTNRRATKLGYFIGVRTEYGSDFDQFLLSYQVLLNRIGKPQ
jgi:hypothetical protein